MQVYANDDAIDRLAHSLQVLERLPACLQRDRQETRPWCRSTISPGAGQPRRWNARSSACPSAGGTTQTGAQLHLGKISEASAQSARITSATCRNSRRATRSDWSRPTWLCCSSCAPRRRSRVSRPGAPRRGSPLRIHPTNAGGTPNCTGCAANCSSGTPRAPAGHSHRRSRRRIVRCQRDRPPALAASLRRSWLHVNGRPGRLNCAPP